MYLRDNYVFVGRGGTMVESKPFDLRVVGSNPSLATTQAPWTNTI